MYKPIYYQILIYFQHMVLYVLFQSATGFALFQLREFDQANTSEDAVLKQVSSFQSFSKIANLKAFYPFVTAQIALDSVMSSTNGKLTQQLSTFLSQNIPVSKKKGKVILGVNENKLAGAISQALGIQTITSKIIIELIRGFRNHFVSFLKNEDFSKADWEKAQLGLAHSFSRNKISLDVNRQDKPIIQSICLLQLLDKDVNTLSMRIRQWFSWHFPELSKLVSDNNIFVRIASLIENRERINQVTAQQVEQICGDSEIAVRVIELANSSMGQEMSQFDTKCIKQLCEKTLKLYDFRKQIQGYMKDKMEAVAPNLTSLIGQNVGAKLISHSGSLVNLAKYPASTVQILGAQKALFRALKTKSNTPKYGLLYHSTFIGRAIGKNKGKISRFLANKCSIAARLDHFLINPTNKFGDKLKQQVQTRMKFLNDGGQLQRNEDVMEQVMNDLKQDNLYFDSQNQLKKELKKKKKQKKVQQKMEIQAPVEVEQTKPKKKKKIVEQAMIEQVPVETVKKSKRKQS